MPKRAYIVPHLNANELKDKYRKTKDSVESRRWHFLWKVAIGWSVNNSARAVGISTSYGWKILKKYNEKGICGITNEKKKNHEHSRGLKPLLNEQRFLQLTEEIKKRPADGGIWTGPKVARWIEEVTGMEKVWNQRGWDYLKKLKYSWQKPRPKHRKGNPLEQENFKLNFPKKVKELQKKFSTSVVEVWFFDEHRVGLKPIIKKIWSRRGERPTAIVQHRYEWLYIYGFVEPKTGKTLWYLIPRVNHQWLNVVYEAFARDVGINREKIVLVVEDNAGWHRSEKLKIPEGILVDFLPAYSPELQPAERLWALVDEPLVNQYFETIEEIEDVLALRCCTLQNMTEEIKNLTNYHWLSYS